jgi:alpha-amylase
MSKPARALEPVPPDRAFYFYSDIGRPLGVVASSLKEFGALVKTVDASSLEFHLGREDFERWILMLGDGDLVKSLGKVRESKLAGEKLRAELVRVIQTRVKQLQRAPSRK